MSNKAGGRGSYEMMEVHRLRFPLSRKKKTGQVWLKKPLAHKSALSRFLSWLSLIKTRAPWVTPHKRGCLLPIICSANSPNILNASSAHGTVIEFLIYSIQI